MLRLSDLTRKLFRRAATTNCQSSPLRTRLDVNPLEDRVVPASIAMTIVTNEFAPEGGTAGVVRVSRSGNTTNPVVVNFSIGGTATSGVDFTALGSSITIASGHSYADVEIEALHDGVIESSDETVILTLSSGTGYFVDSLFDTATITIVDTDILPAAFDGLETTSVNEPVEISVIDLATSLYGDTLTVTSVTQGENGSVVDNEDGTVTYTPGTDFVGEDSFTFTVEDEFGNEATGTVTITVTAPIAPPTSVWTATNTPVTVEVLELAFDPDGDTLTATAVTQGSHGTVVLNLDGTVTYTPTTSYTGDDSFTYTVEDPDGNEASHTITVTVGPIDPVALDDEAATPVNTAVNVAVLDIAFDPAGDTLEVISVTQGAHGTVVIETDGTVTYTPTTSFTGTDSFTYTVEDDDSNTSTGTITVTVGTPPPGPADEIIENLTDLEDEIENYSGGSLDTIVNAASAIADSIDDYLDNFTTLISTNSVNSLGTNKSFDDFLKTVWAANTQGLYPAYMKLLEIEAALWSALVANKNLIESIKAALAVEMSLPTPNGVTVALLTLQLRTLTNVRSSLAGDWFTATMKVQGGYKEALQAWVVLTKDLPETIRPLFAPPVPPNRDTADIFP